MESASGTNKSAAHQNRISVLNCVKIETNGSNVFFLSVSSLSAEIYILNAEKVHDLSNMSCLLIAHFSMHQIVDIVDIQFVFECSIDLCGLVSVMRKVVTFYRCIQAYSIEL